MAARRSRTTALRRRRPRRSTIRHGRASMGSCEPIAQGCTADGGGRCPSHGDGRSGDAPVSSCALLWLTKCGQRARAEAVSHWSSGGGVAVVEKRRGQASAGYGDGGAARCCGSSAAALWAKKEAGKCEMRARTGAGGCWRVEGARLPALATLGRAPTMRGHFPRHAAATA